MNHTVYVPLLNANEPEATVVDVGVARGARVKAEQVICTLETTKSAVEVLAEAEGYVQELAVTAGQRVTAGDMLCVVGEAPPSELEAAPVKEESLRITEPARRLAEQLGVSLDSLPRGRLITEALVRAARPQPSRPRPRDGRRVIIFGAGGHAAVLVDLLRQSLALEVHGIVDDAPGREPLLGVKVLGGRACLADVRGAGVDLALNAVGGIQTLDTRVAIFTALAEAGFACPGVVHPTAVVDPSAVLDDGHQILALSYVGSRVRLGFGVLINTSSVVSHDCVVGDYSHIAPGALLAGGVTVGAETIVGMGVTTTLGMRIGSRCRIGNGCTLLADVPDGAVVRAGTTWPR
ncbi:MAG TPA: biotin/lipoyl-containing protein [Candidatus Xenobia bacterium]